MRRSWLMCALMGSLAWGQAAPTLSQRPGTTPPSAPMAPADTSASVAMDAVVITVKGVCPEKTPGEKSPAARDSGDCKTEVTRAEFEKLASALAPNLSPQLKRQLENVLPRIIAMSDIARKRGLDKTPQYEETMKFVEMQILARSLDREIQEEATNVPETEVADYYKQHPEDFEQFTLERIFVPRMKQAEADTKQSAEKGAKLTEEQQQARQAAEKAKADEGEKAMAKLADDLRARAAAGEDFIKLQKEAFDAAGMKIQSPTVTLPRVRRTGLPAAHAAIFELKTGEVSPVINDSGGHYIYKVQAKDEIHNKLQSERTRELMEKLNSSFKIENNEAYFGPPGPPPGPGGPDRAQRFGAGARPQNAPSNPPAPETTKPN